LEEFRRTLRRGEDVIIAGPIGAGKTHLAIALGFEATSRFRVLFARAADLVQGLMNRAVRAGRRRAALQSAGSTLRAALDGYHH